MKKFIDSEIEKYINLENLRQSSSINLIASENICPEEICSILSSNLSNKYAEGTIKNRFYSGCEYIDEIEKIAQERCCNLFEADFSNVQPHAGTQANLASIISLLSPGEKILSMNFNSGGHLSHGHPLSLIGKIFEIHSYNVDQETHLINYEELELIAKKIKPKLIISGASSYSRKIDYSRIYNICKEINAYHLIDIAHIAGLIAAKIFESPFKYCDIITSTTHKTLRGCRGGFILCKKEYIEKINKAVMPGIQGGPFMNSVAAKATTFLYATKPDFIEYSNQTIKNSMTLCNELKNYGFNIISGGTDNHLFLIDIYSTHKITGAEAELKLAEHKIYVNKNNIPFDKLSPRITSGIRIGTPFITSQGAKEKDMAEIAKKINLILSDLKN